MPPVRPNEWNTGSTLNTLSLALASTRASACAALARMLRWDSTTPLGVPSDPEVNRITAGSSALRGNARRRCRRAKPLILSARPIGGRARPRDRRAAPAPSIAAISLSSLPFSMKAFEVSTVLTCAAFIAASTLTGPAEKFSIAGTRPMVCSAMKTTATPAEFGNSTPTFSPTAVPCLELAARAPARRGSACDRSAWCRAHPRSAALPVSRSR